MNFVVPCSCGHMRSVYVDDSLRVWPGRFDWMKRHGLCPDCQRRQRAQLDEAAAGWFDPSLPRLVGSPDHVAKAETLRARVVVVARIARTRLDNAVASNRIAEGTEQQAIRALEVLDNLMVEQQAIWWLEHRHQLMEGQARTSVQKLLEWATHQATP